jgi:hypothetical protein
MGANLYFIFSMRIEEEDAGTASTASVRAS